MLVPKFQDVREPASLSRVSSVCGLPRNSSSMIRAPMAILRRRMGFFVQW